MLILQTGQHLVDREDVLHRHFDGQLDLVDVQPLLAASVAYASLAPGLFHQNPPHGEGGGPEEVGSAVPGNLRGFRESEPDFMHEGRGLEGLTRRNPGHAGPGESAQLVVELLEELLGGTVRRVRRIRRVAGLGHGARLYHLGCDLLQENGSRVAGHGSRRRTGRQKPPHAQGDRPIMDTLELLTVLIIPSFLILDLLYRARRFGTTRWWRVRAFLVSAANFFFAGAVAGFWSELFAEHTLLDLSGLGLIGGSLVGILVYELFHYGYHQAAHSWSWLWRGAHQMHHSAESLDAFGAYYLHPMDTLGFTSIASLVFFPLLGVSLEAGAVGALFLTFNAMFQHANIRTPRWLGYLIQRPESHGIHHARGVHRYNYSDLPLWDMVFGTFRNPESFEGECGLEPGASSQLLAMLVAQDVSGDPPESRGPEPVLDDPSTVTLGS